MSRKIFTAVLFALTAMSVSAQQAPTRTKEKKEKEEITIKKKSGSGEKMTIVIDGDRVTVNGKPLADYSGDELVIRSDNGDEFRMEMDLHKMQRDIAKMEREMHRSMQPQLRQLEKMRIQKYPGPGVYEYHYDNSPEFRHKSKPRTYMGASLEKVDKGVKVTDVVSSSPAATAGLKDGDIITKFNGKAVTDPSNVVSMVQEKKPGDQVEITYLPVGQKKEKKVNVKLGEKESVEYYRTPRAIAAPKPRVYVAPGNGPWGEFNEDNFHDGPPQFYFHNDTKRPMLGIKIQDLEDSSGVKVLDVDDESLAETAGIKEDDIITQIDGKNIKDTDGARQALWSVSNKNTYSINLKRNGTPVTVQVKIPVKLKKAEL